MTDIREVSMSAILASLFVVLNTLPFSSYIGGPAFITAAVIMIPLMAWILSPKWAFVSGLAGGAVGVALMMGPGTIMGPYAVLIPAVAAGLGSIAFHSENALALLPPAVLIGELFFYLWFYKGQATSLWGIHYIVATTVFLLGLVDKRLRIFGAIAISTMLENAMLNIGSLLIVGLPAALWTIILPASIMERTLAAVISLVVIVGVDKSKVLDRIGWKKK